MKKISLERLIILIMSIVIFMFLCMFVHYDTEVLHLTGNPRYDEMQYTTRQWIAIYGTMGLIYINAVLNLGSGKNEK